MKKSSALEAGLDGVSCRFNWISAKALALGETTVRRGLANNVVQTRLLQLLISAVLHFPFQRIDFQPPSERHCLTTTFVASKSRNK